MRLRRLRSPALSGQGAEVTPIDLLGQHLREIGGGWVQLWDVPTGFTVLVYRNRDNLHAGGHGVTPSDAIKAALAQMGVEVTRG